MLLSKDRHLRRARPALQASLAAAALSGCLRDVALYEPLRLDASSSKSDADADAGARSDAGRALVLPQPDAPASSELPNGACGASVLSATSVVVEREVQVRTDVVSTKPATFYLMFDQSLSMGVSQLWAPAVSALKSFISSDKSRDVSVGLQYFPIPQGQCGTGEGYITPDVAPGLLPGNAAALEASLDEHTPAGLGTPMQGALVGVTEYCKAYQATHPGEQCVSILTTDGKPELSLSCEEDPTELAAIAQRAHEAGVITFAVGLKGANFALLDEIARKGGAPDCDPAGQAYACDVSAGPDKLADALASIRDSVVTSQVHTELVKQVERVELSCEWNIPEVRDERGFDRDRVNIRLKARGDITMLVRVPSLDDCNSHGWYYDNPDQPTRFVACPAVCDSIERASDAQVDILLGCRTWLPE